jgi:hypothetical protein
MRRPGRQRGDALPHVPRVSMGWWWRLQLQHLQRRRMQLQHLRRQRLQLPQRQQGRAEPQREQGKEAAERQQGRKKEVGLSITSLLYLSGDWLGLKESWSWAS